MSDSTEPVSKPIPDSHSSPDSDSELPESISPPPTVYSTDPLWSDVAPLPQQDGPFPVVKIAYTQEFREVHDYLRALLKSNEVSARALSLTEHALKLNPANYTTWQYRRVLLKAMDSNLDIELEFNSDIIEKHPKNYQVWFHRQKLTEWRGAPGGEFDFTADCLKEDAKNYHVWQYRQWLLEKFPSYYPQELEFVDSLIKNDVRNNSAWNQRYYVLSKTIEFTAELVRREIEYTKLCIRLSLHNESPWNYLRGILNGQDLVLFLEVKSWILQTISHRKPSIYAYSVLIDICEMEIEEGNADRCQSALLEALNYCQILAEEMDIIRVNFWKYTSERLKILANIHGVANISSLNYLQRMTACPSPQPKISLPALPYPPVTLNAFQTSTNIAKEISLISRGSYAVLKPIGKGSMGIVYLIQSTNEDSSKGSELFAMKEMDYGSDGYDEYDNSNKKQLNNKLKLIQREIRILSHLSHPNIVHYYTSMLSVANSSIQLVQEYCNRGTLYQAVKERKLAGERHYSEIEMLFWSAQLASALTYLHESKILHRDLKSQNIFLTSNIAECHTSPLNTAVKLGDFGISRPLEGTCDLASTCVGTPAYMAPEVCHKSLYSFPCDVWSLGCVLVEICCLKPAFQSAGLVSMVFKILSADYTRVPGIYSQALTSLIDSLFQAEPELRPTAKQVFNIVCDLLYEQNVAPNATSNSLEDYENDFDSLSDHSGTINLEISQEMATLSFIPCQDALDHTKQQTTISANDYDPYTSLNREISHLNTTKTLLPQTSDHYSDDFDSFSENEDD